ncbi:MAG: arginase [Phycisphaerae bacterium]
MAQTQRKRVRILGAPLDLGSGRRGVDMGPSAVRVAGLERQLELLGQDVEDYGDIDVEIPETQSVGDPRLRYADVILKVVESVARVTQQALDDDRFPLMLGGDHSIAIGSVAGSAAHFRERKQGLGVIWFDAHGDMNTAETTPSGNIHGMSLAILCGLGDPRFTELLGFCPKVRPDHVAIVGVRDIDAGERDNLRRSGVRVFTMRDVDELGIREVMSRAITVASRDTEGIHLQFDTDALDPAFAPGTGTPVRGGISYREAHLAMEMLHDSKAVRAVDLVEVNPVLDERNRTAELGVELILSLFGKSIL